MNKKYFFNRSIKLLKEYEKIDQNEYGSLAGVLKRIAYLKNQYILELKKELLEKYVKGHTTYQRRKFIDKVALFLVWEGKKMDKKDAKKYGIPEYDLIKFNKACKGLAEYKNGLV